MGSEVIPDAMMKPEAFDEKITAEIMMIQTHISWVFLTGDYAYKIKKPVDFGFLDFSTLDNRKKYCNLELRLNKVLCPDMYLEVLPVTETGGRISVNGSGKTIDYALKMRQMPQERLMNRLIAKGDVDKETVEKIARTIADFHQKAEQSDEISGYGKTGKIRFNCEDNFAKTEEFIGKVISKMDFEQTRRNMLGFIEKNKSIIDKRIADGKVRRIHGDMHSGNIFIVDDKPLIFDRIEFNMRFSCMDVAADVAFLSMDLDFKNRPDLADFFVEKYIGFSDDKEIMQLLDFYKCYYAWVRGEVTALRLKENLEDDGRDDAEETSRKYLRLALDYSKGIVD